MPHDTLGNNIDNVLDEWDNSALDTHPSSHLYKLLKSIANSFDEQDKDLENIYDQHIISQAGGDSLERLGQLGGVNRKTGESDDKYRQRIKSNLATGRTDTTFETTVEIVATIMEGNLDQIELENRFDASEPAKVFVWIEDTLVNNSALTGSEIVSLLEQLVPAGHRVEGRSQGTFEVKSDGQIDDADLGLTGDNISTGGTLSSDL